MLVAVGINHNLSPQHSSHRRTAPCVYVCARTCERCTDYDLLKRHFHHVSTIKMNFFNKCFEKISSIICAILHSKCYWKKLSHEGKSLTMVTTELRDLFRLHNIVPVLNEVFRLDE